MMASPSSSTHKQTIYEFGLIKRERDRLREDLHQLENENISLENEKKRLLVVERSLKDHLNLLQGNYEDVRDQCSQLASQIEEPRIRSSDKRLILENEELRQKIRELENAADESSHVVECPNLTRELNDENFSRENDLLRQKLIFSGLRLAEQDDLIARLQKRLSEQEDNLRDMERERARVQEASPAKIPGIPLHIELQLASLNDIKSEFDKLSDSYSSLEKLHREEVLSKERIQDEIVLLKKELFRRENLENELQVVRDAYANYHCDTESALRSLGASFEEAKELAEERRAKLVAVEAEMASLRTQMDTLLIETSRLSTQLATSENLRKSDLEKTKALTAQWDQELITSEAEKKSLGIKLEKSLQRTVYLEAELSALRQKSVMVSPEMIDSLESENEQIQLLEECSSGRDNNSLLSSAISFSTSSKSRPSTALSNVHSISQVARMAVLPEQEQDVMENDSVASRTSNFRVSQTRLINRSMRQKPFRYNQSSAERRKTLDTRNQAQPPHLRSSYPAENSEKNWRIASDSSTPQSFESSSNEMAPPTLRPNKLRAKFSSAIRSVVKNPFARKTSSISSPSPLQKTFDAAVLKYDYAPVSTSKRRPKTPIKLEFSPPKSKKQKKK